jgi:hypothetical protein
MPIYRDEALSADTFSQKNQKVKRYQLGITITETTIKL